MNPLIHSGGAQAHRTAGVDKIGSIIIFSWVGGRVDKVVVARLAKGMEIPVLVTSRVFHRKKKIEVILQIIHAHNTRYFTVRDRPLKVFT